MDKASSKSEYSTLVYSTWVFDCDGVLLNSNKVKSDAFYKAAQPYGENAAAALLDFHIQHGGISRFEKFKHLFSEILGKAEYDADLNSALSSYGRYCNESLLHCETAPELTGVLERIRESGSKTFVVSGGYQDELRNIFKQRSLDTLFDGIYGSPDNKVEILTREISNENIILPAIFVGDSQYDYQAAHECGLHFMFVSDWTEFANWNDFFKNKDVQFINNLSDLLNGLTQTTGPK